MKIEHKWNVDVKDKTELLSLPQWLASMCVLLDYRLVSQRHLQQNLMKYYCANSIYGYHLWFLISKPVHELFEWEKWNRERDINDK